MKQILRRLRELILMAAALALVAMALSWVENRSFRETFYEISSLKVTEDLRILQISDLHTSQFGEENRKLLDRIEKLAPDLIVMTGDCIEKDTSRDEIVLDLCGKLTKLAPVYYIYGNVETTRQYGLSMTKQSLDEHFGYDDDHRPAVDFTALPDPLRESLEAAGVTVLLNSQASIQAGGTTVDIYGTLTSNPSAFWPYAEDSFASFLYEDREHFKLLLVHEPYLMEVLEGESWGDLILCGHTHGGMARLPYLGGVYEHRNGLFPEYRGKGFLLGQYDIDGTPLIVSSGLSNQDLLRINNQRELVITDITRY